MGTTASARTAVVAGSLAAVLVLLGSELPAAATDATSSPSPTASPTASSTSPSPGPTASSSSSSKARATARAKAKARAEAKAEAEAEAEAAATARAEAAAAQKSRAERAEANAKAAELARQAAETAHDAKALVEASAALAAAESDLVVARTALATAQDRVQAARQADAAAQTDLDAAVLTEERATRDLADVEARIASRHQDLGRLARAAYQSNGSMGEWSLVLSSDSTNQLIERLAVLQSLSSAGNAVIADLAVDRADLVAAQNRLSAARRLAERRRQAAAAALSQVSATELVARAAVSQVDSVVKARKAAVDAAREAAIEDRRQYQVLMVQSGALGARISDLSRRLAGGKRAPQGTGRFARPGTGDVTSGYGPRLHPILDYVKIHTGTDIGAGDGIVYAADDGVVLFTEYNVAYGNMTVVDHGKLGGLRVATLYAHQSAVGVEPGDRVVKGQAIGVVGSTGYSTGPHLHFEVRVDGEPLDPAPFLRDAPLPSQLSTSR